jgi:hypothetical protein
LNRVQGREYLEDNAESWDLVYSDAKIDDGTAGYMADVIMGESFDQSMLKDIKERNKEIVLKYTPHMVGVINMYEIDRTSGKCINNLKHVRLWGDKEYGEWDTAPYENAYSIEEMWLRDPIPASDLHRAIIRAAGMVSDISYYGSDTTLDFDGIHLLRMVSDISYYGSDTTLDFDGIHLLRMRRFVEHFTSLNLKKWDKMMLDAPRSGPGMIRAISDFCNGRKSPKTEKMDVGLNLHNFIKETVMTADDAMWGTA